MHGQHLKGVGIGQTDRRAVQTYLLVYNTGQNRLGSADLVGHQLKSPEIGAPVMCEVVITDYVTPCTDLLYQFGVLTRFAADTKKSCGYTVTLKQIQNSRGTIGIGAVVECECRHVGAGRICSVYPPKE
jgi:hypothetical protein